MADLCGVGSVVHKEKVEVADVVDEEGLVAGGHHVACLLVGPETDLKRIVLAVSRLCESRTCVNASSEPITIAKSLASDPAS